ncbi:conserved hypothetical protein [Beggiatoa sp. PS]|nr:conserved hypothetical protein [Beggiatoa sp. PS]
MKNKVYIETSIPSFYHNNRTELEMMARRNWTREWWDNSRKYYNIVTSQAVLDELRGGDFPTQEHTINLLKDVPLVPIEPPISEIVQIYIQHRIMPNDPLGDALHLALASFHKCDFLLTWNCKHIANANKFTHIKRINVMLDLFTPMLVTPLELIWEDNK